MGDIVMGLAIEYAKARGLNTITDKALEYAYETLGIEPEEDDYINEGGIYGVKNAFSPRNIMKSLGRNVLSGAAKKAISGSGLSSMMGPGLLMGGALMLGRAFDPTRPGSRNYNPNLAGQIESATGRGLIGTNPGSGLQQYGPGSVLSGQNVKSMFGTNSHIGQLNNYKDKYGPTMSVARLGQLNQEIANAEHDAMMQELAEEEKTKNRANYSAPYQGKVHGDGDGSTGTTSGSVQEGAFGSYDGSPGRKDFSRGGIGNINMNKGQLGETLYG